VAKDESRFKAVAARREGKEEERHFSGAVFGLTVSKIHDAVADWLQQL